ncbi:tetratricopeptide repeat protein [Thiohalorhabdus sp. Cl-TMA]|uniref:Tetratricopeptide repeat protein n=1 Tax=Thiohalorhabdus methylotrophus TaxID=3242694 RepID=A0ABV4TS30_9GAMM
MPHLPKARSGAVACLLLIPLLGTPALAEPQEAEAGSLPEAIADFERGRFREARAGFRAHADSGRSQFYLGRIALRRFEPYPAAEHLRKAVASAPDNADFHYWLGRAYGKLAERANIFKRAYYAGKTQEHFQRAVELEPEHLHARVALVMYDLQAPGFLGGSREAAERHTGVLFRQSPVAGLRARGLAQEQEEAFDKALATYRHAAELAPEHHRPHRWLAGLHRQLGHYERAFALYAERLARKEPDPAARVGFARTALASGTRLEEAADHLRIYIERGPLPEQPTLGEAHYLLGKVRQAQGRLHAALRAFQRSLEVAPNHPRAGAAHDAVEASLL